jgi:hypothetical protein
VKVTMLLADYAQVADGKLTAVGAGWTTTPGGRDSIASAIGLIFWVPWDRTNVRHPFTLKLLTEDGEAVLVGEGDAAEPLEISNEIEVGRPPGVRPGAELSVALALVIGPLGLPNDRGFVWRLELPGEDLTHACSFRTLPPRPQQFPA